MSRFAPALWSPTLLSRYLFGFGLAGLLWGSPAVAADHLRYVDASLVDANPASATPDCTDYDPTQGTCGGGSDSAYRTIQDVNRFLSSLAAGDAAQVLFKRGDRWTVTTADSFLKVNHERVSIGAFGSGELPTLDGEDVAYSSAGLNAHPALIQVSASGCTVESIRLVNAYGTGIRFGDVTSGRVSDCQVDKAGWAGVAISGTSSGVTVERCSVTRAGYRANAGPEPESPSHPQAINANTAGVEGCLFRYNHVYNCWTEGIGASGHTAEFNLVGPTTAAGIYAGEKTGIIRYNIVYGTPDPQFHVASTNGRGWCSQGISVNEEKSGGDAQGSEVYGNIVIGRRAGMRVMNMTDTVGKAARVYQNTFIDNAFNIMVSKPEFWNMSFQNNLSVVYDTQHCRHVVCWGDSSAWQIGPNHWSSVPEDDNWYDASRDEISDPGLPRTTGWTELTGPADFLFSELVPPLDSTAVDNPRATQLSTLTGYAEEYLTAGTDHHGLPGAPNFVLASQDTVGDAWEFGAIVAGDATEGGGGSSASGGSGAMGGNGGLAGSGSNAGMGGSSAVGGWSGSAGSPVDLGSSGDDSGCVCGTTQRSSNSIGALSALTLLLVSRIRRRHDSVTKVLCK